jgi:hypothetical protein
MADVPPVVVVPIQEDEVDEVAEFLHGNLNNRVPASVWRDAMTHRWVNAPNLGFLLRNGRDVVGVYLAFYSERVFEERVEKVCNLGAWCVLDAYRSQGLRLLRAILAQKDYTFTDLSPSGNVVGLNQRLRFTTLDTATAAVVNLPWITARNDILVTSYPQLIEKSLTGTVLSLFQDHKDLAAARSVLIRAGEEMCYVILRRDRRKRLPIFGSVLYVSNPDLFRRAQLAFSRHVLRRHRVLVTLAELRVVGERPRGSVMLRRPRPKMFKSARLGADEIDYLYSELTNVAW